MEFVNLDTLVWFQEGPGVRNYQYVDKGIKLINVTNLVNGELKLNLTSRYISEEEAFGKYKHFMCDIGDLVIASSGITYDTLSKKIAFVSENDLPLCMNTSVIRFKPLNDDTCLDYIYYFFKSEKYRNQISKLMTGTAQLNYGPSHLHKVKIPLYNYEKQKSIASELKKIDENISICYRNIENLNNIVKSQFIEMFETLDLSEERKEWIEIKDVSKIYTGTTPSTADETNWDGDILWITPAEMNSESFYINDTLRKITEKGRKSKSLDLMPVNTVLLSTRAPIGKVGIVGVPMTCNQGFKNFECCNKLNPIYLYTLLKNNTEYLNTLGSGTTFLEVSKSTISKLRIPLPEIELQNKFADFVQQIDKSKLIVIDDIVLKLFWEAIGTKVVNNFTFN